jgi:hypothetical protein
MTGFPVIDGEDCIRIQRVMLEQKDIFLTIPECNKLWGDVSEGVCASWMGLPPSDEVLARTVEEELS